MASPFPGMDPYLEDPVLWPGVHDHFIIKMRADLNARLPKHYVANIQERVFVEEVGREIIPDVHVKKKRRSGRHQGEESALALADPSWELELSREEIHEPFIEIVDLVDKKRIVTTIEFLSPTNKWEGSEGRKQYLQKQGQVLSSKTHLLEIDLLRHGEHTVSIPYHRLKRRGEWDYLLCLSRADKRDRRQVWPVLLASRLPRIVVPLTGKDPEVVVDLQNLLNQVYEEGAYGRQIDYREDPTEPLTRKQALWADKLLRKAGLRR